MKKPVLFEDGNGGAPVATGEGMTPPEALPVEKPTIANPLPIGPGVGVGLADGKGLALAPGSGDGGAVGAAGGCCPPALGCCAETCIGEAAIRQAVQSAARAADAANNSASPSFARVLRRRCGGSALRKPRLLAVRLVLMDDAARRRLVVRRAGGFDVRLVGLCCGLSVQTLEFGLHGSVARAALF